ncbi:unnamed protein product [Cladocopium goreaui]|uniref:Uncharacterized protein n=1 Tax=Cladocopium goreaui TaxID=2562237 RepID=A0A9P1FI85_9DINO|nr:unnamed protein product [Cladocopium goreaui]
MEIRAGRKSSHWIWYVWPSLVGVRKTSRPQYSLRDLKDVESFLRDRTLRQRLMEISEVAHGHLSNGVKAEALFGARVDVEKFRECCTCFALVALSTGDRPLAELMMQCLASLGGALDSTTVEHLSKELKDFAEVKSVDDLHPLAALASEAPEVAVPPETGQTDRGADDSMA